MQSAPQSAPKARPLRWRILGGVALVLAVGGAIRAATIKPVALKPYLADSRPVILAHQGASAYAPSDTIESFKLGMQQGADIIETDLHMTKDGALVLAHDETVDRLTNGTGAIEEMTLAELRQLDFGYKFTPDGQTFPWRGKGVTIPTLEEVFQQFPGVRVNLELKLSSTPMEPVLYELVKKYHMEDKVGIASFHAEPGPRYRALDGGVAARSASEKDMYTFAGLWVPGLSFLWQPNVELFQLPTAQKVGPIEIRLDTPRLIKAAHKVGVKVHYWTINDEATMRHLLEIGADGIITDRPDMAQKVMSEMGLR
ncbi:MAG TPA: glycerophosphodiester phosphodiesterase [Symbiobacteriaceae bacterium]|nr:glycerophosphodiester phosphodiesterase [Symbiobacteriaceae bacterium]